MKIGNNIGINPLVWGGVTQAEFLEAFKGKEDVKSLKKKYKECAKIFKDNEPKED